MDNFNSRDGEEDIFAMMRQPEGGTEFGPGMEVDQRDEEVDHDAATRGCDDDSQIGGHPRSGEVY